MATRRWSRLKSPCGVASSWGFAHDPLTDATPARGADPPMEDRSPAGTLWSTGTENARIRASLATELSAGSQKGPDPTEPGRSFRPDDHELSRFGLLDEQSLLASMEGPLSQREVGRQLQTSPGPAGPPTWARRHPNGPGGVLSELRGEG